MSIYMKTNNFRHESRTWPSPWMIYTNTQQQQSITWKTIRVSHWGFVFLINFHTTQPVFVCVSSFNGVDFWALVRVITAFTSMALSYSYINRFKNKYSSGWLTSFVVVIVAVIVKGIVLLTSLTLSSLERSTIHILCECLCVCVCVWLWYVFPFST
jgi:hypothetical protein